MITKIVAPTNNVNDTSVVVYELLVKDESEVKKGQAVLIVETSKATVNIESPVDGFIHFAVQLGDEIPNGQILALVADTKEELASLRSNNSNKDSARLPTVKADEILHNAHVSKAVQDARKIEIGIFNSPVTLGEIMFKNGSAVKADDVLCKVRHSDKVEAIKAPFDGFIFWNKKPYEAVKVGESIGVVSESPIFNTEAVKGEQKYQSLRLSKAAETFLKERGLTAEDLGLSGLVTVNSIREKIEPRKPADQVKAVKAGNTQEVEIEAFHSTAGHYEKLSKAKRAEGNFLSRANREAVVSQVTVLVSTQGIFSACAENPDLARKFSSIIILETSRLLKSYPAMNAVYDNGQLYIYDAVNIGYAVSIDDGLKVPVFKNSDKMDLDTIMAEKDKFVEKYIGKELSPDDLTAGTFTITDLSSTGSYLFNPVLNLGQSAILGIGGENTAQCEYPLILAFDHKVIDGATATEFLCKLRDRLIAHENVLIGKKKTQLLVQSQAQLHTQPQAPQAAVVEEQVNLEDLGCDACFRSIEELDEMGHYLFKVIDKNGKEKHICSICMRGW